MNGMGVAGPFNYESGESKCLDMAFIFARDSTPNDTTSHLKSVGQLQARTAAIQAFYEQQNFNCDPITETTGLSDKQNGQSLTLYPNPADKAVSIQLPRQHERSLTLKLMNTNGQTLIEQNLPAQQNEITLSLKSLPKGLYPLQIQNSETTYQGKVIKQ